MLSGINDDWDFEEHLAREGCQVWGFDPSVDIAGISSLLKLPDRTHFFKYGISDVDYLPFPFSPQWPLLSLKSIFDEYKIGVADVLKMDIEGFEFRSLTQFALSDGLRDRVKQIVFEVHFSHIGLSPCRTKHSLNDPQLRQCVLDYRYKCGGTREECEIDARRINSFFDTLEDQGFVLWANHPNPFCSTCLELSFLNRKFFPNLKVNA